MDQWAQQHGGWTFLCICVLGSREALGLAKDMGKQMKLKHCVNGFVDRRSGMPPYGQLGCSGFIMLDHNLEVVNACTSAYLQVRQLAFKHVEALMTAMDAGQPFPPVCPGEMVQLSGLAQAPQYNGQVGLCFALEGDRIAVALRSGKQLKVRHANAVKVADDGAPDTTASCSTGTCGPVGGGSCSTGSCSTGAQGGCGDSAGAPLQLLPGVRSVQVPSMDAEHEQCVARLNALAQTRNVEALQELRDCLAAHFAHEEQMFEEFGFGGDGAFSASKSHAKEHARMLRRLQERLDAPGGLLDEAFVRSVMTDFVEHAEQYDDKYSAHMVAAGAQ
mmetsp:Transcript_14395/g.22996  ORF Transcript_14395/g.22996 Transcript_14395/m.22996 type:complete len:332 (+) Transcript_14395:172-1167(+)